MKSTWYSESPPVSLLEMIADIERSLSAHGVEISAQPQVPLPKRRQHIRFGLGPIRMAIPIETVLEIGKTHPITPLPNLPGWVAGVSNIRGEIVSMVNLHFFFNIGPFTGPSHGWFMVLRDWEMKVGVLVERIYGMASFDRTGEDIRGEIFPAADTPDGSWREYVMETLSHDNEPCQVLNVDKLLASLRIHPSGPN